MRAGIDCLLFGCMSLISNVENHCIVARLVQDYFLLDILHFSNVEMRRE